MIMPRLILIQLYIPDKFDETPRCNFAENLQLNMDQFINFGIDFPFSDEGNLSLKISEP